jgi:hypothetical protein
MRGLRWGCIIVMVSESEVAFSFLFFLCCCCLLATC